MGKEKKIKQKIDTTGVADFGAVKNGRLVLDPSAQLYGFRNEAERQDYIKEKPELYSAMGGYKYIPTSTPLRNTDSITNSNKAIQEIIKRFRTTDENKVQDAIKTVGSSEWQDADTMKKHKNTINSYVNDYVALENLGYFNHIPEKERKKYSDALKATKNLINNNQKVFANYSDADSYKEAVKNFIEYEKVRNGNLEELESELKNWEKEWNAWNEGTNSTLGNKEWIMHEWRFNNDGQRTIPYDATSYPEIFMGKTIMEAKEIIDKRKQYLRLAKKDTQINNLANEAQTNVDFEEISSYKVCDTEKELLEKYDTKDFDSNNLDLLVDYLCTDSKAVRDSITNHKYTSYLETYGVRVAESVNMLSFDWAQKGYDQLTNEEKKVVKYFAKNDTKKLHEYLKLNEEIWKNRGAKQIADSIDGNVLGKASYAIAGTGDRIKQSAIGALNYITGKEDYVEPTKTQLTSQYIRENLDGFGGFLYDAAGAITYMTPAILMNAILPGSGFAVTGITAAGGAYNDGIKMGMTKSQARTYGTLIGASETVLSKMFSGITGLKGNITKIGVEKITSGINNGILRFVATIGVNASSEGFEEFAQEVLEPLYENIALGYNKNDWDDIDWNSAVYNGLIGAFLGSTSNVVTTINDTFSSNKPVQKLNPDEVIDGIWEDSPNQSKKIVEKSQLDIFDNNKDSLYNINNLMTSGNSGEKAKPYSTDNVPQFINRYLHKLRHYGETLVVEEPPSFSDISLMSRQSGTEFASISIGDEHYIIKGNTKGTPISNELFEKMRKNRGILNCHSHPFIDDFRVSKEDINVAKQMYWQKEFYIISPDGKFATYDSNGIIDIDIIKKKLDDSDLEFYRQLFGVE